MGMVLGGGTPPLAGRTVMKDLLPNRLSAWKLRDGIVAFVLQRIPWGLLCAVPVASTAACRLAWGLLLRLTLENASVCDLVPLGILPGIVCSSQLPPSLPYSHPQTQGTDRLSHGCPKNASPHECSRHSSGPMNAHTALLVPRMLTLLFWPHECSHRSSGPVCLFPSLLCRILPILQDSIQILMLR